MAKVRVFYRADGGVTVRRVNKKMKLDTETDTEFFDRMDTLSTDVRPSLAGASYEDIEEGDLPVYDSKTRNKWRKNPAGRGVIIDNSVVTKAEKKQMVEDELDAELARPNTDMKKAMLLRRKLDKGEYD